MEQQRATELVLENLQSIYRFSMARLYDKTEAEDLANDILYEILKSAHRLKDDKAFYGFMWRIADNTFKRHLRSKRSHGISESGYTGVYWDTPESEVIHRRSCSSSGGNWRCCPPNIGKPRSPIISATKAAPKSPTTSASA